VNPHAVARFRCAYAASKHAVEACGAGFAHVLQRHRTGVALQTLPCRMVPQCRPHALQYRIMALRVVALLQRPVVRVAVVRRSSGHDAGRCRRRPAGPRGGTHDDMGLGTPAGAAAGPTVPSPRTRLEKRNSWHCCARSSRFCLEFRGVQKYRRKLMETRWSPLALS